MTTDEASHEASNPVPFPACKPDGTFVFVSYAHADSAVVYRELERIAAYRVRIWYDEGIEPTNEWPEEIGRAIRRASLFVVMITPASAESRNVRNEVNAALRWGKPVLAIHLTRTVLSEGMELQLGSVQAIMRWRMDDSDYVRRLSWALSAYATHSAVTTSEMVTATNDQAPKDSDLSTRDIKSDTGAATVSAGVAGHDDPQSGEPELLPTEAGASEPTGVAIASDKFAAVTVAAGRDAVEDSAGEFEAAVSLPGERKSANITVVANMSAHDSRRPADAPDLARPAIGHQTTPLNSVLLIETAADGLRDTKPPLDLFSSSGQPVGLAAHSGATRGRHRNPSRRSLVMSSVLALFVLIVAASLIIAYQQIRGQFYVGTNKGMVVIFRGINQSVFGISLSSIAESTGIPAADLPASDLDSLGRTSFGSLPAAQQSVVTLRQDFYTCKDEFLRWAVWTEHPTKQEHITLQNGHTQTKTVRLPKPKVSVVCMTAPGHPKL